MSLPVIVTDEDLMTRAIGDWKDIAPKSQKLAGGADGVFGSGDLWTLSSASNNFATEGVIAGNLLILTAKNTSDVYGVVSAISSSVTLRRPGLTTGLGMPPAPLGGSTGNTFSILTASPQIAEATYEVFRRYDLFSLADLQDANDLRQAVVLTSLVMLYNAASRNVEERADDFAGKARMYKAELNKLFGTLDQIYGANYLNAPNVSAPMTNSTDACLF